jgi:hypothetical protein
VFKPLAHIVRGLKLAGRTSNDPTDGNSHAAEFRQNGKGVFVGRIVADE